MHTCFVFYFTHLRVSQEKILLHVKNVKIYVLKNVNFNIFNT
jgi:hypothetical protein